MSEPQVYWSKFIDNFEASNQDYAEWKDGDKVQAICDRYSISLPKEIPTSPDYGLITNEKFLTKLLDYIYRK
tara:strand:+ start:74 stop:289 length:216 start_codon:yes stop_codon:yes gene_type:complete